MVTNKTGWSVHDPKWLCGMRNTTKLTFALSGNGKVNFFFLLILLQGSESTTFLL